MPELSLTTAISFTKGLVSAAGRNSAGELAVAGTKYFQGTQTLTTTPAALDLNGITTLGYVWLHNLDGTTINVLWRPATGAADAVKVRPGGWAMFESNGNAPFVSCSSSSIQVEYFVVEA